MSLLAWIDFDEAERQRAQRIMALFQERESRDELGLGAIRDSIADHLFPGTSTIQTRLRYMLFIPWLFQMLERREGTESQIRSEARALENRLSEALKAGGETLGVIGRDAGAQLQRLPSSVYWAGLGAWGIREFPGSIDSLYVSFRGIARSRTASADVENDIRAQDVWVRSLPKPPQDLLEKSVFGLTAEEAQFLIDRLVASHPAALLTFLARENVDAECDFIWTHPRIADFSENTRQLVKHGEIFSQLMHGSALIYNLALSQLRERDEWATDYRERIRAWKDELDLSTLSSWSLESFWLAVEHPAHTIRPPAKRFVTQWLELVKSSGGHLEASSAAFQLVEERERRLKTSQSRFTNHAVRDRWSGASGIAPFGYRWNQAKSHLRDLAHAK